MPPKRRSDKAPTNASTSSNVDTKQLVDYVTANYGTLPVTSHFPLSVLHTALRKNADAEYICPYATCIDRTFGCTAYPIKRHLLTHANERPHKCTQCTASFRQKTHLEAHVSAHHGGNLHKCSRCDYSTAQRCNLLRHMRLLHNDGAVEVRQRMLRSAMTAKQKNIARQPQHAPSIACQRCHRAFFALDAYRKHKCMITIAIDGNFTELTYSTTPIMVPAQSSMTLTSSIRMSSAPQFALVLQPRPQPSVSRAESMLKQEEKAATEKKPIDAHNDSLEKFLEDLRRDTEQDSNDVNKVDEGLTVQDSNSLFASAPQRQATPPTSNNAHSQQATLVTPPKHLVDAMPSDFRSLTDSQ